MDISAAVVNETTGPFSIETVTLGEPEASEVLVKIAGVGLCHTDLAVQAGHLPFPLPAVLGHEGSGTVVSVGAAVTKVKPGDKVALSFNSCGTCKHCAKNEPAYCHEFMPLNFGGVRGDGSSALSIDGAAIGANFFGQSSLATHAIAHERNVVRVADDAPLELIGPLGCGIQTGAGAVLNSLDCEAGSTLLVLGGGSVGLSAVMAAAVRELSTIIVVEPHEARRKLALDLGATHVIDPATGVLSELVRAIVPAGVDYAVDTTAVVAVLEQVLLSLGHRGTLGTVGVPADPAASISWHLMTGQILGLKIIGIVEGDSNPDVFIPHLLDLHRQGKFPFEKLITTMPFGDINEAVAVQHRGEAVKIVLVHN